MSDSRPHPLTIWMQAATPPMTQARAAEILGVSKPYLSQVISGKKAVTFKRAAAWSKITGQPIEAFMQSEAA